MPPPGDALIDGLAARGYAVARDAVPDGVVAGLRERARTLDHAGAFAAAGVGRADERTERADVRGDRIAWLPDATDDESERAIARWLDALRLRCNRELMLGLEDVEAHYA